MQLKNDFEGFKELYRVVRDFYRENGGRHVSIFSDKSPDGGNEYYVRFLMDRRHVVHYGIVTDRGEQLSGVALAIGPHYFSPADFWSYDASARFKIEASTEAIMHNLALLDEFLGYPDVLKKVYGYKES